MGHGQEIVAFEPQERHISQLHQSLTLQPPETARIRLQQAPVGRSVGPGVTTLDAVKWQLGDRSQRDGTLIKIDVEGAELEVLDGSSSWLRPGNLFVIEVHQASFLKRILGLFADHDLPLKQINQHPLPLLGGEWRETDNCWLVSE